MPSATTNPPANIAEPMPTFSLWAYAINHWPRFLVGGIFLLLTTATGIWIPWMTRRAITAIENDARDDLITSCLAILALALTGMTVRIISRTTIFYAGRDIEYEIRTDLFRRRLRHPPSFFAIHTAGDILNKSITDLQNVRVLLGPGFLNIINTPVAFVAALAMMVSIDWRLSLLALIPYPAMMLLMGRIAKALCRTTAAAQQKLDRVSAIAQENLSGIAVVKAFGREDRQVAVFERAAEEHLKAQRESIKAMAAMMPIAGLMTTLGTLVVLWFGGRFVIEGSLSLGDFVAFNGYLAMLAWPTLAMGWIAALWQRGMASLKRIEDLYNLEPTIEDAREGLLEHIHATNINGEITVRNLTFTYPNAPEPALENVSLTIHPGETVAIVGRTGSGKTTLLNLITRLVSTPEQTIFLDGYDVTKLPRQTLRAAIRVAPQTSFLFSRKVRENIGFAPRDFTDAAIRDAAQNAVVEAEINELPEGYDTVVGERGIALSGGQRQRVALARTLADTPRIVILDDSLSALDTSTERKVLDNLRKALGNVTAIIVSHRASTAMLADNIIVLDEGCVVEQGTHEQLMAKGEHYARMVERQRIADELGMEAA